MKECADGEVGGTLRIAQGDLGHCGQSSRQRERLGVLGVCPGCLVLPLHFRETGESAQCGPQHHARGGVRGDRIVGERDGVREGLQWPLHRHGFPESAAVVAALDEEIAARREQFAGWLEKLMKFDTKEVA